MPNRLNQRNASKWTYVIEPKEGELFSAWLTRNALAHGCSSYYFCSLVMDNRSLWYRDVDRFSNSHITNSIVKLTGLAKSEVDCMFINSAMKLDAGRSFKAGVLPFVTCVGINHTARYLHGLSYCPRCLAEFGSYKLAWRLAHITICDIHHCELLDACPHCDSPIILHRVLNGDISTCSNCFRSLIPLTPISDFDYEALQFQNHLSTLILGSGIDETFSEYFATINQQVVFFRKLLSIYTTRSLPCSVCSGTFEKLRLQDRKLVLSRLSKTLDNWPFSVIEELMRQGVSRSFFSNVKGKSKLYSLFSNLMSGSDKSPPKGIFPNTLKCLYKEHRKAYKEKRAAYLLDCVFKKLT